MKYFRDEFDTLLDSINNEKDELTDLRKKSFENFIDNGLPTNKWEDWQFTNFSSIEKGDFRLSSLSDAVELTGLLPGRIPNTYLIVSINGYYQPNLSDIPDETDTEMMWYFLERVKGIRMHEMKDTTTINQSLRLTLDFEEDYWLLSFIQRLLGTYASREDINNLFSSNPDLAKINLFRNNEWKNAQLLKIDKNKR